MRTRSGFGESRRLHDRWGGSLVQLIRSQTPALSRITGWRMGDQGPLPAVHESQTRLRNEMGQTLNCAPRSGKYLGGRTEPPSVTVAGMGAKSMRYESSFV